MSEARTLNVADLPAFEISNKSPLWLGQTLLCVIEGTMFSILLAMYFYYRLGFSVWPPPGVQLPHTLIPTLAWIPLALSVLGSYWASEGAKRDDRKWMLIGLLVNLAFALVFLGMRAYEWVTLNFSWSSDLHGSIFWAILYLHTIDISGDLLMTAVLIVILARGRYGEQQRLGVHVDSVVWYFLVAIWVPLYAVIYWGPHVLGAP
ncbi:MAG TPA: cytochrome c oxidase subunit 3 [Bryobacteraceae bacterium]|nr:cytochrome c oxidase subunit 3 [Bryobacteraceae bacterium]